MRKHLIYIYLLSIGIVYGQTSSENMKQYVPNIFPPAPSVANLMKFEEVPVNNYTGVPDISVPIVNISTQISDLPMNIAVKYHTYNAKSDSKAGEVGLGWSLLAGGSISRTVVGSPDEITVSLGPNKVKIGMYYDEYTTSIPDKRNYSHLIIDNPGQASQIMNINQFAFEGYFGNKYDMQYDLYQYNFMNYTGRFIVKKVGGALQAVKLDKNNLKIKVLHSTTVDTRKAFEPLSFEITDDQGNIFVFDVVEKSTMTKFSSSTGLLGDIFTDGSSLASNYNSAYHLSKIKKGSQDAVRLQYGDPQEIKTTDRMWYRNTYLTSIDTQALGILANKGALPRTNENHSTTIITQARSIKEIEVVDKGRINFEYEYGREDSNFEPGSNQPKLSKIMVRSIDGKYNESYDFSYVYKNKGISKRLFLTAVEKKYEKDGSYQPDYKYTFDYYGDSGLMLPSYPELTAGDDQFFTCTDNLSFSKCPSTEVLRSVTYPTKGKSEFIYEPNTYSYKPQITPGEATGADEITNFDENPLNWDTYNTDVSFNNFNEYKFAFSLINETHVTIDVASAQIDPYGWLMKIYKKEGSNYTYIQGADFGSAFDPDLQAPSSVQRLLPAGNYYFKLEKQAHNNVSSFSSNFHTTYKEKNLNNYKYLYDFRGIRIERINYYSQVTGKISAGTPQRTVIFNYQSLHDPKKSTGALVSPPSITSYNESYKTVLEYPFGQGLAAQSFSADLQRTSGKNYLASQKTKGSDVGYQFVSVSETGNGKTVFQYTSPIDKPNLFIPSGTPPFNPVPNYDFMRGNLLNKKVYDKGGSLLSESKYTYNYSSETIPTGFGFEAIQKGTSGYFLYGGKYPSYASYLLAVNSSEGAAPSFGPAVNTFLAQSNYSELAGTANMIREEQIQYFPNQTSVMQAQDNIYNSLDYIIKKSISFSDDSVNETTYSYAHEKRNQLMIDRNIIGIPMETITTQTKEGVTKTLGKTETLYPTSLPTPQAGNSLLPLSVKSSDQLTGVMSTDVTYDKYDQKGNILQYTTRDGIPATIVWGYNSTQPIAKVEGITYDQLTSLASPTAIITASDNDAADPAKEGLLLTALNTFRKNSQLADKKVTTYTYDPLIGVTSITPPSGIRQVFTYDTANRLKETKVRSKDTTGAYTDKKATEYKYNYKP
jgi:hypothetical protein